MKLFFSLFAACSLWECCGRHPAWAGLITLLGAGTVIGGAAPLTPPAITPQPSLSFLQSNSYGYTNQPLRPNQGTAGAFSPPSTATNSFAIYHEFTIDPNFGGNVWMLGNSGSSTNGLFLTGVNEGAPQIIFQGSAGNSASVAQPWWLGTVGAQAYQSATPISSALTGTGYNQGLYQWTAVDGCPSTNGAGAREPSGPVQLSIAQKYAYITDPGFLCGENSSGQAPQVNFNIIPGVGAAQSGLAATCAPTSPTSYQYKVTVTTSSLAQRF